MPVVDTKKHLEVGKTCLCYLLRVKFYDQFLRQSIDRRAWAFPWESPRGSIQIKIVVASDTILDIKRFKTCGGEWRNYMFDNALTTSVHSALR